KTELLKTTNGGQEWVKTEFVEQGNYFYDIYFINELKGWIGAYNGCVLETNTGGENWDTIFLNTNKSIIKVQFFDNNNGKALTKNECFITTDGGETWTIIQFAGYEDINAASLVNENFGCAVGFNGKVFYTNDGGYVWESCYPGTLETLNSICIANENKVYAVGSNGTIVFSDNAGESWNDQNSNTTKNLLDVCFIDENTGWAIGSLGTLLYTNNSGSDWITKNINTNKSLNAITFISSETGWITGNSGVIFKTIDSGENWLEQSSGTSTYLKDVEFIDTENGWIVGDNGIILNTYNGGTNWIIQDTIGDQPLNSVCFVDQNKGWIAGYDYILNTINGGDEWTIQYTSSFSPRLYSIMFTDDLNGWACGRRIALHTTNGGLNWVEQNTGVREYLNSVTFIDNQNGYIAGRNGTILFTNNGTCLAPYIIQQPGDTVVCTSGEISFELDIIGTSLNFQWFNTGDSVSGATTNTLIINPVTVYDAGLYNCQIFNEGGSVVSNIFLLTVMTPPEITGHPTDITANINTYIAFNLAVIGTLPFFYQWQKNGVDIPGGNFHIYPIESVQLSDTGYYRCRIFNDCDTVYTDAAKLTVIDNTGINEMDISQCINIFPNPASNEIFIEFKKIFWNEHVQISVFDIMGNNIHLTKYRAGSKNNVLKINWMNFPGGIYFLKVQDEKMSVMKKFILR
ncbi:MAG: T9SS type A sorting domain-containing protein, partial [Bacteroidales bacterium]|nr:T9SS type A sorting domain-containing protein [Bacteroidales bacterium]